MQIMVHEGTVAGDTTDEKGCCDLVASRDGVIDSVVTLAGTPAVSAGETVRKGQVLIRGEERGSQETVHPVAARGLVMAYVWDAATARVDATEIRTEYTGREEWCDVLTTPWFSLTGQQARSYEQQDVTEKQIPLGGLFIPVTIHRQKRMEAVFRRVQRSEAQLQA